MLTMDCVTRRGIAAVLLLGLSLGGSAQVSGIDSSKTNTVESSTAGSGAALLEKRAKYQRAKQLLASGKITAFREVQAELTDYPLYPYLEFNFLSSRLSRIDSDQVTHFLQQHRDTPLAARLQYRWLRHLARRGQWQAYLDHYDNRMSSTELRCHALWAEHKRGNTATVLSAVEPLWMVAQSQPDACDPVFKLWRESGQLTDELAWKRFSMAIAAGRPQLASYLIRFISREQQKLAQAYRAIRRNPQRVASFGLFSNPDLRAEEVVIYGMKRLAYRNPAEALEIWKKYGSRHDFGDTNDHQVHRAIALGFARHNQSDEYQHAFRDPRLQRDTDVIEAGIAMAVRLERWRDTLALIQHLPTANQQLERWRYWFGRSLYTVGLAQGNHEQLQLSREVIADIATRRSFYGFMAADHLQQDYQLNHTSYAIDGNFLALFRSTPAVLRARELRELGEMTDARREWRFATTGLSNGQQYTAAHYAYELGWYSQSIRSAIAAERWDDLNLRFPPAHEQVIAEAAESRDLQTNWLLAMARQESAMDPSARSPKGAIGLLQLMPATARAVARKHNFRYRNSTTLLDPNTNANFGAAYLQELADRFNGNMIYATAAYNAGPGRVNGWLRNSAHLPIDVWIENIPYAETRQYVKNVLAFSVIYAHQRQQAGVRMATAQFTPIFAPAIAQAPASDGCQAASKC